MKNPFEYGGVVGQGAFCNRKQELEELRRVFENAGRLFMYSERRVGKTSLVKLALSKLPQSDFITAYVDLWPTTSGNDLALRLAKAVGDASASTTTKLINLGKKFFSSFQPSVSIDQSGAPQLVFGLNKESLVLSLIHI
jgi:AAA+ ATPase superfamily predicted ATPase